MHDVLFQLTQWLQPYYIEVAMTFVATLLVVYGDVVNKHIKRMLSPYPFVVRTLVFVLVCAFGYGAFILFVTPFFKQLILMIPSVYQGISIVSVFLLLGYMAERRRYI
ncbi:DUF3392 domain-containing protein [Lacimicrobium alkaliphilum]|uniref:DUF3392 domain-containing protein n=1 Tax=Lacimicrobium alkaliphilum TaxID=1526571 RepID=A0A0U2Z6Z8_9ALTE|nr:DUF3392 domain-containing protein [Lacimicrobium alkaliphilum]ALS98691.1 hypothetical protein AT746_10695 [Lacimicrobium alkaliphilum]